MSISYRSYQPRVEESVTFINHNPELFPALMDLGEVSGWVLDDQAAIKEWFRHDYVPQRLVHVFP
jgi:hypothetical protein